MAYALIDYPNDKGVHAAKVMDESELGPDLSNVTAQPANVEAGIVFVDSDGEEQEGTMPIRTTDVEIDSLSPVAIPAGSYDGTVSAKLSSAAAAEVVASNIRQGAEILGVQGSYQGADTLTQMITGTLTKYVNNEYTGDPPTGGAPDGLFTHCYSLEEIQMDALLTVPNNFCFAYYTGSTYPGQHLKKISFASATKVGGNAFKWCSQLTDISLPSAVEIGQQAFMGCGSAGFAINLPSVTTMGRNPFESSGVTSISCPSVITMGQAFGNCLKLVSLNLPNVEHLIAYYGQGTIINCPELTVLDFPKLTQIDGAEFPGCTKLATLILRADAVCTLSNANSFQSSPFASNGSGGTLYVPQAQISNYQSATNWSVILAYPNNHILPIEGSQYEVTT